MNPFANRVLASGPGLVLSAKAAQNFSLALHELATNAAKYGSLSNTTVACTLHGLSLRRTACPNSRSAGKSAVGRPLLDPRRRASVAPSLSR